MAEKAAPTPEQEDLLARIPAMTRKQFLLDSGAVIIGFSLAGSLLSRVAMAASAPSGPPKSWVDPVAPGLSAASVAASVGAVDQWLAINSAGTVLVSQSQPDVGTGAITGMLQIVAEELYVPFSSVSLVPISTNSANDGGVGGSSGVSQGGSMLRAAAAQARETLLQMAATKLGVSVDKLTIKDGVISAPNGKKVSYAALVAGKHIQGTVSPKVKLKPVSEYTIVGKSVQRVDIATKLTAGKGQYNYLVNVKVKGMVHARWLKPPSYGATIMSADTAAIEKMPGVIRVLPVDFTPDKITGYNTGMIMENFQGFAVIAETEWQAISAMTALAAKVTWSPGAKLAGSSTSFGYLQKLPVFQESTNLDQGDFAAAEAKASDKYEATYSTPYLANAPIGPSTAIADVQKDHATIWSDTQDVWGTQATCAGILGMPTDKVKVISYGGSGVYGRGNSDDAPYEAAYLSQQIGRPVRVQWMRQEEFEWSTCQGPKVLQLRGGLASDGKLNAARLDVWTDVNYAGTGFGGQTFITMTPRYEIPNLLEKVYYVENPLRKGLLRAVGGPSNAFAWESFMDELAAKLHKDPLAYRLAHLSDPRQIAVLSHVAKAIGYKAHTKPSGQGIGLATFVDQLANTYVAFAAKVSVDKSTGAVQVERMETALDCGLAVNPDQVKLQMEGGTIQSMSWAMYEQLIFDDHMITSNDWISYPIAHFEDIPTLNVTILNRPEYAPTGMGEPPTLGAPAAVANAIYDATGVRLRSWPFSPAKVLAGLKAV
jgi:nicotinate dehydrogenase subunit B